MLPSVCTCYNLSRLTFTPHLIQKYTGIHIIIAVTILSYTATTNNSNRSALHPDPRHVSISCTFILTSHWFHFCPRGRVEVGGVGCILALEGRAAVEQEEEEVEEGEE